VSLVEECFGTFSYESRYDTLFLWLYAEPTELKRRLDIRADEMLHVSTHLHQVHYGLRTQNGLLEEVCELSRIQGSPNKASLDIMAPSSPAPDFTHGVFQSIGKLEWITVVECSFDLRDRLPSISSISH
jgi:tRNA A37 N6-isopentenylltransferase MiaA